MLLWQETSQNGKVWRKPFRFMTALGFRGISTRDASNDTIKDLFGKFLFCIDTDYLRFSSGEREVKFWGVHIIAQCGLQIPNLLQFHNVSWTTTSLCNAVVNARTLILVSCSYFSAQTNHNLDLLDQLLVCPLIVELGVLSKQCARPLRHTHWARLTSPSE